MFKKTNTILLVFLSLFAVHFSLASDSTVNNVIKIGGAEGAPALTLPTNNANGTFSLFCRSGSAGVADAFFKNGVPYQVTAGTTFEVAQAMFQSDTAGDRGLILSDTAPITAAQALNTLAAVQYMASDAALTNQYILQIATAFTPRFYNFPLTVSATRYIGCSSSAASAVFMLIGREI